MQNRRAVRGLAALANGHRLAAFRLLVRAGPEGRAAGEIAAALGLAPSSLSFHVAALAEAGLVRSVRVGRSIRYRVAVETFRELLDFLTADCCEGRPELCPELRIRPAPVVARRPRRVAATRRRTAR
jgi:DNA-binding transcriptional ArsR family regulator